MMSRDGAPLAEHLEEIPLPHSESQPARDPPGMEVLTLSELAAYLRVPDKAVLELVAKDALPGQLIGGEWRFLKRAVIEWLWVGNQFPSELRIGSLLWMLDRPFWDHLFQVFEQRIQTKSPETVSPSAMRGSKQSVLRHFGVFKGDPDIEEQLDAIRAGREAAGQ